MAAAAIAGGGGSAVFTAAPRGLLGEQRSAAAEFEGEKIKGGGGKACSGLPAGHFCGLEQHCVGKG